MSRLYIYIQAAFPPLEDTAEHLCIRYLSGEPPRAASKPCGTGKTDNQEKGEVTAEKTDRAAETESRGYGKKPTTQAVEKRILRHQQARSVERKY